MKLKTRLLIAGAAVAGALALVPAHTSYAATGWQSSDGSWIYIDSDGSRHKGWIKTTDGYYYMDLATGLMSTGWKKINSKWYFFKSNGLMNVGWIKEGAKWYYNLLQMEYLQ